MKPWQSRDNTDGCAKAALRQRLLSQVPAPRVLDCFAGSGHLWRSCYQGLPYLGLDRKPSADGRPLLRVDNRAYLRSADLSAWNVFDLDAYGSPWHQFLTILHRRPVAIGEVIALALTDGLQFKARMGDLPHGMKPWVGIPVPMRIPCLGRHHAFLAGILTKTALARAGLRPLLALQAGNPKGTMRYYGLVLTNNTPPENKKANETNTLQGATGAGKKPPAQHPDKTA